MKVNVERQLSGGKYTVAFKVRDFSTEELAKMASFGVPNIALKFTPTGFPNQVSVGVAINQINDQQKGIFASETEARAYERSILEQIALAMQSLRERKDDFTSSSEVAI